MIEQVILTLFTVIVLLLNGAVLFVTYWNSVTKFCPFCRVFSLSYLGNIMGALSLFVNDIIHDGHVAISFDSELLAKDKYFFLYMGVGLNICGLVTSTYVRYYLLKSIERPKPAKSTFEMFIKFLIPQILLTAFLAGMVLVIQQKTKLNLLTLGLLLTFIPLCFVIIWNVQLTLYLQKQQRVGRQCNLASSVKRLKRAQIFILGTTCLYVLYLIIGIVAFTISLKYIDNRDIHNAMFWILRILFLLMFTLEAKMFLYKVNEGRKTFEDAFRKLFCCKYPKRQIDRQSAIKRTKKEATISGGELV